MFKKMSIDEAFDDLKRHNRGRQCFSLSGVETLLDFYDEIDPSIEFDAIAILCEWTEYSPCSGTCTLEDLITDYGYLLDREDDEDDEDDEDYIERLVRELEYNTTVLHLSNGGYLVSVF